MSSRFQEFVEAVAEEDSISPGLVRALTLFPFCLVGAFALGIAFPLTRHATLWCLLENHPVELMTFAIFVAAGVYGLLLAGRIRAARRGNSVFSFYLLFSLGLLAIGGEEVSWGQQFLGFDTPEALREVNAQREITLHNVGALQEYLEVFPLLFGLGGLIGLGLERRPGLRKVSLPRVLALSFLVIAGISGIDLMQEFVILHPKLDNLINDLDEVVELLIAVAGFVFLVVNARKLFAGDET